MTSPRSAVLEQVENELDAQFLRIASAGLTISHVDGHRHVHMIPRLLDLVTRLARRYGCRAIRVPDEPIVSIFRFLCPRGLGALSRNLPKKLVLSTLSRANRRRLRGFLVPDRVFGVLDSGGMNSAALVRVVSSCADGLTEIITHPGTAGATVSPAINAQDQQFTRSPHRERELRALLDSAVRDWIEQNDVHLVRFRDVVLGTARCVCA